MNRMSYTISYYILNPFVRLLWPFRTYGKENKPAGAALVCANHQSNLDPALLAAAFGTKTQMRFMVSASRVIAIVSPESAPIKRIIQDVRDRGQLIDATYGRRTRAVVIMDSGHVILSAIQPETVAGRMSGKSEPENGGDPESE